MQRINKLIAEIHRRSLWQVLLIYIGGALVAYQAVQALTEGLGLPQWFPGLAVVLFIIGLPVVIATAFVPDQPGTRVSDEAPAAGAAGVEPRREATARRRRFLTWRNAVASFVVVLAVWGVVATGWLLFGQGAGASGAGGDRPSIAVLPFANRSGLESDQYFTDGIHDEILTQLSKISGLSVRGRTSVMEYRDSPKNLRQIGDELNARYLLEGGVQRAGETVRITAQLVDSEDDDHVFADTYDRQLSVENLLAVQREVALRIADALEATLTAQEREQIERAPTGNLEAYDYYLRGKEYGRRAGSENRRIAKESYLKAVELDPEFALAHAALSSIYSWEFYNYRVDRSQAAADRARAAAERAVALDPDLAEAHLALGYYFSAVEADYDRALEEYTIARRLNPNDGTVHRRIGTIARRRGEWDDALASFRKAVELGPRDPDPVADLAGTLTWMRRYDEAVPVWERLSALAPDHSLLLYKGWAHLNQPGGIGEAVQVVRGLAEVYGEAVYLPSSTRPYLRISLRVLRDSFPEVEPGSTQEDGRQVGKSLSRAIWHSLAGDIVRARAYYDSARVAYEAQIEESLESPYLYSALGISYAGLGRAEDAIREARRAVELAPISEDALYGPFHVLALAEVYVMVGEYDAAIDQLETVLSLTCPISPPLLEADPIWDPLRDNPRFQALLEKYE
jgi:TolB-like protein